jgi:hypothetical protein
MDEQLNDDWLDKQLREEMPYIDDDGFTAGVLKKLPVRRRPTASLRALILLGMTMLAGAVAYILSGDGQAIAAGFVRLALMPTSVLLTLALVVGVLVTFGGIAAALSKTGDRLS